jgi:large subunit ribosomal protein L23
LQNQIASHLYTRSTISDTNSADIVCLKPDKNREMGNKLTLFVGMYDRDKHSMTEEQISDKELDAMIDESIKTSKSAEKKPKAPKKEANAAEKKVQEPAKEEKKQRTQANAKEEKHAALKTVEGYDPWDILIYPHLTEKSMNLVERNNVLVFVVSMKANKKQVKDAVEKGFGARVISVRLHITKKNQKKAYVRLAEGVLASDIATRLGMI